jgi:hypothetical protein
MLIEAKRTTSGIEDEVDQIPARDDEPVALAGAVVADVFEQLAPVHREAARRQLLLPISDNYFCRRRVGKGAPLATAAGAR